MDYLIIFLILGVGMYVRSYIQKKAENLASKEDIEQITKTVETLKASIGSQQFIHQTRYQNEFKILTELSEKIVDMKDATLGLRPIMDWRNPKESDEVIKQKRLNEYNCAMVALYKLYQSQKPFYPDSIYGHIRDLVHITRKEAIEFSHGEKFDKDYWEKQRDNSEKIVELSDEVVKAIRERVQYWEKFEIED